MPAHIHAELMIQYGHDALITDKPWRLWECRRCLGINNVWRVCDSEITWSIHIEYRRKQKTININGFEVPEPVRDPLEVGQIYYASHILASKGFVAEHEWNNTNYNYHLLKAGLIHLTPEAAELHAKALLSFTKIDR